MDQIWLAGGLEHDFSPYIGNSNPNWRTHIFHVYFFLFNIKSNETYLPSSPSHTFTLIRTRIFQPIEHYFWN
jgi:hypothetical protein